MPHFSPGGAQRSLFPHALTTGPIKVVKIDGRAFCKIPQATDLWVGRGDREFEG